MNPTDREMPDHDALARAFRAGDAGAFRRLVESQSRTLMATAWRYTADWETARDLTQATWVKVWERADRWDPGRPFRPWLLAVHRNTCLSWLRRAARRREELTATPGAGLAAPAGEHPEAALGRREFAAGLRQAIRRLSRRQLAVFTLVDLEQTDQREAAGRLNMAAGTLRATLHAARRKLAGQLRKLEVEP
ncbi:MAG: RNA polymerase sigma factor [Candidatus Krumholzibacteriota bacterium]|nr:RNA polymerase sigma factor [Candidatus Krumholzibacteriota bacterium]